MSANPTGIDPAAATEWLVGLGIGIKPPLAFTRIGDGKSNLTVSATDTKGDRWVLRRPPLGERLSSAHDVVREFGILERLDQTDVPVPSPIAICDDDRVADTPVVLLEYVEGLVIDSPATAELLPTETRRGASLALANALAKIHAVDLEATGLSDLASHAPYARRQLKRWLRQWEGSKTRELPIVEELHGRLERAMPAQRELSLVHGDFHLLNVLVDRDSGSIRAVLDWELSTLGDPLADLGGLLAYWPQADDAPPVGPFMTSTVPGFASRGELVSEYARESGQDVGDLGFWHVLGSWKVAIIIEGVRRRGIDRGDQDVIEPEVVTDLLDQAVELAEAEDF